MIKKKKGINNYFLYIAAIFCIAVLIFPFVVYFLKQPIIHSDAKQNIPEVKLPTTKVFIGKNYYQAEVATTDDEKILGLGKRKSLGDVSNVGNGVNNGMLFVFSVPLVQGFWMKDMNFPIDIIWIDQNKKIIGYVEGAMPEDYPKIYESPGRVAYVLEIASGQVKSRNIKIGDTANFTF